MSLCGVGVFLVTLGAGMAQAEEGSSSAAMWNAFRSPSGSPASQAPAADRDQNVFRQTPTLSGRLQISEQTLLPFVGAGFGGGYVTERDRAIGPAPSILQQSILGDSLSRGMMPNEFQLGIRIPF
ncbi:MAG: hypothetical protein NBKEAIPA_00310 [Nitrospirae bacterium]|nr:hypothetical protein [Nitrospirota bacterium]